MSVLVNLLNLFFVRYIFQYVLNISRDADFII